MGRHDDAPAAAAFVDLLSPHVDTVTRVARRFAPPADAEDIAQEALLAAWRYRRTFDPTRGSFRAWLLGIVMTESRRAGGQRMRRERLTASLVARARTEHGRSGSAGADRSFPVVEAAIAALSRRQREVIGLHYFVDLPVDEVAAVLGVSPGTVKSTLAAGRARLKDILDSED